MSNATFGQALQILKIFKDQNLSTEHLEKVLRSGILTDVLDPQAVLDRDAVRKALTLGAIVPEIFTLQVDYSRRLNQMIQVGHYDDVDVHRNVLLGQYSITGSGVVSVEARFFRFDGSRTRESMVKWIEDEGWRPACIEHLLAFGEKYPDEQRRFSITAIGSTVSFEGGPWSPQLRCRGANGRRWRVLSSTPSDGGADHHRFLAVRPIESA